MKKKNAQFILFEGVLCGFVDMVTINAFSQSCYLGSIVIILSQKLFTDNKHNAIVEPSFAI